MNLNVWEIPVEIASKDNLKDYGQLITADELKVSLRIPFYKGTVIEGANLNGITFNGPVVVRQSQISPSDKSSQYHNVLWLERHVKMTQGFIGLGLSPFVLVLGKATPHYNKPDLCSVKAFVFKPGTAIFIHFGTWHDFPIAIKPFTITFLICNSKEVVDALASMKEPDEMNFGDCQKLKLSKHFGKNFAFNADTVQHLCFKTYIEPICNRYLKAYNEYDNVYTDNNSDNKYAYKYGKHIMRKEINYTYASRRNQRKVAVIPVINVELFIADRGGPSIQPHLRSKPEIANSGWRDYGNRAGIQRLSQLFKTLDLSATVVINSDITKYEKGVVEIIKNTSNWEIAAHGINNSDGFRDLLYKTEQMQIEKCLCDIQSEFKIKPTTWLTPGFSVTNNTTEILAKCGVKCVLDFVNDDVPYLLQNKENNKIIAIPYSLETNDISLCVTKSYNEYEYGETLKNHILEMAENNINNKMNVVCLGMHTFIAGVPSRIRILRNIFKELKQNENIWIASANQVTEYLMNMNSKHIKSNL